MGYSRSLNMVNRNFALFKQILQEPEVDHSFQVEDWRKANKLAYNLREGMYAAQFHHGFEHIARLRDTHKIKVENDVVRVLPKYDPGMIRRLQPLPLWARYGKRRTAIVCEAATTIIDVVGTLRDLTRESPWDDVSYPDFRFDKITSKQRAMLLEMATAVGYKVLDLEEEGLSLVRPGQGEVFNGIYYDLEAEADYDSQT